MRGPSTLICNFSLICRRACHCGAPGVGEFRKMGMPPLVLITSTNLLLLVVICLIQIVNVLKE